MRHISERTHLLSILLLAMVWLMPAGGWACSYASGLRAVSWPETEPREDGSPPTPAPVDTHIWFTHVASNEHPSEVVLMEVGGERVAGEIQGMGWPKFRFVPKEPLKPNTRYKLMEVSDREHGQKVWTFVTGAHVYQRPAPVLGRMKLFEADMSVVSSCGSGFGDRRYLVQVPEPLVPEPFFYEFYVGEPSKGQSPQEHISSDRGSAPRPHARIVTTFDSEGPRPCVHMRVTDIVGRSSAYKVVCRPLGCLDSARDGGGGWWMVEDWEKKARPCQPEAPRGTYALLLVAGVLLGVVGVRVLWR